MKSEKVFLITHRHSDLVWRRTKSGYDAVRERQILQQLDLAKKHPSFTFCYAQTEILRAFIEAHPEREAELKKLVREGRVELAGGLVSIPDTNMVTGESLLRNFLAGRRYCQKEFGVTPDIGWLMDCFGMCAQLPQILTKLGYKYLYPGRMPGFPDKERKKFEKGFKWEGLDGSAIPVAFETASVDSECHLFNLPVAYTKEERIQHFCELTQEQPGNVLAFCCSEEGLVDLPLFDILKKFNAKAKRKIVFAQPSDYFKTLDVDALPSLKGEFNPTFTGCYTTIISVKQLCRAAESLVNSAERLAAVCAMSEGTAYPRDLLDSLWNKLFLAQFHDSICGCHVDSVYYELVGEMQSVTRAVAVMAADLLGNVPDTPLLLFNPVGSAAKRLIAADLPAGTAPLDATGKTIPVQMDNGKTCFAAELPSLGFAALRTTAESATVPKTINDPRKLARHSIKTDAFDVEITKDNVAVTSKKTKRNVFAGKGFGEILYRCDEGTLWIERLESPYRGLESSRERVTSVIEGDVFSKVTLEGEASQGGPSFGHNGHWHGFVKLAWKKEFIFPKSLPYFKLRLTLDFKGENTKVSVAFPLNLDPSTADAIYETPFGCENRKPYFEVPSKLRTTMRELAPSVLASSRGDWPALNWVDYSDDKAALAIANNGTPGHQLVGGRVLVSLLRSPTEKASAFFPGPAAHENRTNVYEFEFLPHEPGKLANAVALGQFMNNPPFIHLNAVAAKRSQPSAKSFVAVDASNVVVSAFKKAEDGSGWIVRLYEAVGQKCRAKLEVKLKSVKVYETDMAEKIISPAKLDALTFIPFEVKTFLVKIVAPATIL